MEAVRRRGERRRALGVAAASLAVLAMVSGAVALGTSLVEDGGRAVQPAGLPPLDFDEGARAFYDDGTGEMHLGGAVFDLSVVSGMDTSASSTPFGVLYFGDDQAVRLLTEDGTISTLADGSVGRGGVQPRP